MLAAPAQDRVAAAHQAADSDYPEAAALAGVAVPLGAPPRAALEARAVRLDPVALGPAADQEAAWAGLVLGFP